MLVLTRKSGERIRVGEAVQITVLDIGKGKVKLGFAAPLEVSIRREEVQQRIDENRTD
jgi:carbon storage regulator